MRFAALPIFIFWFVAVLQLSRVSGPILMWYSQKDAVWTCNKSGQFCCSFSIGSRWYRKATCKVFKTLLVKLKKMSLLNSVCENVFPQSKLRCYPLAKMHAQTTKSEFSFPVASMVATVHVCLHAQSMKCVCKCMACRVAPVMKKFKKCTAVALVFVMKYFRRYL